MDYRGPDLDLRTSRWAASSTDPTGWRETAPQPGPSPRQPAARGGPIWVDEIVLAGANQAYDVALAYRSPEVRIVHLLLAMTRIEAAAAQLEARGVGVAALRRDSAITIAAEAPAAQDSGSPPRRSAELEDVLRLSASRAAQASRAASVEDIVQVLSEVGGDLQGAELISRHFPRAARSFWGPARPPQGGAAHLLAIGEADRGGPQGVPMAAAPGSAMLEHAAAQRLLERVSELERHLTERLAALEGSLTRLPSSAPAVGELGSIDARLAAIEQALQQRPSNEGVVTIDPAITDRLWAIEHALGTERTDRAGAITALSDEITGVRSAVRLAAQNSEQAQTGLADQLQRLGAGFDQHRLDLAAGLGDRIASIEQALDAYDQRMSEVQSAYVTELGEVHEALMKISANQHTLAGSIDHWRNNESGEIQLINARIGAVHEDGARRLAVVEKLSTDVETLSQLVLDERSKPQRASFRHWLFGTEDWAKPSWRLPSIPRPSFRWPRFSWRLRRRGG